MKNYSRKPRDYPLLKGRFEKMPMLHSKMRTLKIQNSPKAMKKENLIKAYKRLYEEVYNEMSQKCEPIFPSDLDLRLLMNKYLEILNGSSVEELIKKTAEEAAENVVKRERERRKHAWEIALAIIGIVLPIIIGIL